MKHDRNVEERYFLHLCRTVGIETERPASNLIELAKQLHQTPFAWVIPNDVNRVEDAFEFRDEFLNTRVVQPDPEWTGMDASVLEVLTALAIRCSYQSDKPVGDWFMIFMDNLGILELVNQPLYFTYNVDDILANWMYRNYQPNGVGGLFPLRYTKLDQRTVELWNQMSEYLIEDMETTGFLTS